MNDGCTVQDGSFTELECIIILYCEIAIALELVTTNVRQ